MTDAMATATCVCPACLRGGHSEPLHPGAGLDGLSCHACGGIAIPASGSERLLGELLGLDRAALLELADGFGGKRFPCPLCKGRMRCLVVRGVDVDLCFLCGALWLEQGELERLSGDRYRGPTPTTLQRAPRRAPPQGDSEVRLDGRPLARLAAGIVVRGTGTGLALGAALGLASTAVGVLGVALMVGGFALRRRRVVDVFPRARRLLVSRAYLPTLATDERTTPFDEGFCVVVRPFGPLHVATSVTDTVGRALVTKLRSRFLPNGYASELAARLARPLHIHHSLQGPAEPAPTLPAGEYIALSARQRGTFCSFVLTHHRPALTLTVKNAVPAGRSDDDPFALCFFAEGSDGVAFRLHAASPRDVVIVDRTGNAKGVITRRLVAGVGTASVSAAGSADRLTAVLAGRTGRVLATNGSVVAELDLGDPCALTTTAPLLAAELDLLLPLVAALGVLHDVARR